MSWVGHRLTPRIISDEQYLYQETDQITEIFFCMHGKVAFILPRYNNAGYYWAIRGDIFGLEDAIYNNHKAEVEITVEHMTQKRFYRERRFSTMSINMVEAMTLNVSELMKVALEFPGTIEWLY